MLALENQATWIDDFGTYKAAGFVGRHAPFDEWIPAIPHREYAFGL